MGKETENLNQHDADLNAERGKGLATTTGYVCHQCGSDANGGQVHQLTHHTLPPKSADEAVDDLIDEWHENDSLDCKLHEYLEWTEDQYSRWVETCKLPSHNNED